MMREYTYRIGDVCVYLYLTDEDNIIRIDSPEKSFFEKVEVIPDFISDFGVIQRLIDNCDRPKLKEAIKKASVLSRLVDACLINFYNFEDGNAYVGDEFWDEDDALKLRDLLYSKDYPGLDKLVYIERNEIGCYSDFLYYFDIKY